MRHAPMAFMRTASNSCEQIAISMKPRDHKQHPACKCRGAGKSRKWQISKFNKFSSYWASEQCTIPSR